MPQRQKEYEQIYGIVMDLLEKMVDLLGEERLSVREYREILDAGFEAANVGVIPPGYDRVSSEILREQTGAYPCPVFCRSQ